MILRTLMLVVGLSLAAPFTADGSEPQWLGQPLVFGETRQQIRSTNILYRPYRPLHFYGNTVRRRYYRGNALPLPRDFAAGSASLLRDATPPVELAQ